jgi:hypothetical protein
MQSVKYFLRTIGVPSKSMGIVSTEEAETELDYKYLSQGWKVQDTQYLGALRDEKGNDIGYRVFHVLVKEKPEVTVKDKTK